ATPESHLIGHRARHPLDWWVGRSGGAGVVGRRAAPPGRRRVVGPGTASQSYEGTGGWRGPVPRGVVNVEILAPPRGLRLPVCSVSDRFPIAPRPGWSLRPPDQPGG